MKYERILPAIFLSRPNRFIAHILLEGREEICHVKNTGRCRELLLPGARIYVQQAANPKRKTQYDLIAVYKGERLINMDSQIPNAVVEEWLRSTRYFGDMTSLRREVSFGNSRFDLYLELESRAVFAEVKGVTLEENGMVLFPDAPTQRGAKHLLELCECVRSGYGAAAIFLVQMEGAAYFSPNRKTDPAFAQALLTAAQSGVSLLALDCLVRPDEILAHKQIPIQL